MSLVAMEPVEIPTVVGAGGATFVANQLERFLVYRNNVFELGVWEELRRRFVGQASRCFLPCQDLDRL